MAALANPVLGLEKKTEETLKTINLIEIGKIKLELNKNKEMGWLKDTIRKIKKN